MEFNSLDPATRRDPYPAYARLRAEAAVCKTEPLGMYAVGRYEEVLFVVNHPELFSSAGFAGAMTINEEPVTMMVFSDPPDHARLRNLVNRGFTPKMVADLKPRIREVTNELLDRIAARGETELIAHLAMPLPVTIIAELLGVDPEHNEDFKRWSDWIVLDFSGQVLDADRERQEQDMEAFREYFERAVAARRAHPEDDLISALVQASEQESALTANEVLAFIILLLVAGNETTTNLIGNMTIALLENPDQLAKLRANPALIPNAVEEALRYDAPVQFLFRRAVQDVELAGTTIPAGSTVTMLFGAANRDERKYADSERFDVTRDASGHVAFGHGIHFCLGAPLARLEGRIALEGMLARLDNIQRTDEDIELVDAVFLRGPKRLPLTFTARETPRAAS